MKQALALALPLAPVIRATKTIVGGAARTIVGGAAKALPGAEEVVASIAAHLNWNVHH